MSPRVSIWRWRGRHWVVAREIDGFHAMSFGFDVGTHATVEDAFAAVLSDYERRMEAALEISQRFLLEGSSTGPRPPR